MDEQSHENVLEASQEMYGSWEVLLKHITTLATGALVFSMAFQDKLAGQSPNAPWLLGLCWFFLTASILGTTGSLAGRVRVKIKKLEVSIQNPSQMVRLLPPRQLQWAASAVIPCFVIGIMALAVYATVNGPWSR